MINIFTNLITGISADALQKMKDASPEEKQKMAKMAADFLDFNIELLRESPELRSAFARIHSEFFRYPESADTIVEVIKAYAQFIQGDEGTGKTFARENLFH